MNLVRAKLIKMMSADGLVAVIDTIPLGTEYIVDLDSIQTLRLFSFELKLFHLKEIIYTDDGKWLPLEFLNLNKTRGN